MYVQRQWSEARVQPKRFSLATRFSYSYSLLCVSVSSADVSTQRAATCNESPEGTLYGLFFL